MVILYLHIAPFGKNTSGFRVPFWLRDAAKLTLSQTVHLFLPAV